MKKAFVPAVLIVAMATVLFTVGLVADDHNDNKDSFEFAPDTLVLSRTVYQGTAGTVTIGQTLPPGCVASTITLPLIAGGNTTVKVKCGAAVDNGEYPNLNDTHNVWNNDGPDSSFGVTSPIFLDSIATDGKLLTTLPIPSNLIVTSFSSKSELAVNRSTDGKSITFVAYHGGPGFLTQPNQLDVSNSNTPGVVDPTNPVTAQFYRSVAEVDAHGHIQVTDGNAYSGNNGRAAMKANWFYYMTGNDNNGGLSSSQLTGTQVGKNLVTSTGAELVVPGQTPPSPPNINMLGDFEIAQVGYPSPPAPDKAGKDDNFRGLTIFNNTMYVTKGSGGNGINTVYQVGSAGVLPTTANAPGTPPSLKNEPITVLPGFPTTLASGLGLDGKTGHAVAFPFGIWFADASTLYVCDEGDGTLVTGQTINGQTNVASPATLATAGVQKWKLISGTWVLQYVLQDGLNIGVPYSVANYPVALNPATDGCRNITGRHNDEGTVEIYAVTSTISTNGDQGADPNQLVKVTDLLKATVLPTTSSKHHDDDRWGHFSIIRSAKAGEVLRGISFAPSDRGDHDDHHD